MSHVVSIDLHIKDIPCLIRACNALGLEFMPNQKTFKWFGRWMNDFNGEDAAHLHGIEPKDYGKCEHAIRMPGKPHAYEIGLIKKLDGKGYGLCFDYYSQHNNITAVAGGQHLPKLKQLYAAEVAASAAKKAGWENVRVRIGTDGLPYVEGNKQ